MENINKSYWQISANNNSYPSLQLPKAADVLIIGAGLAGINTAYNLMNKGLNVAIIEASEMGYGASAYSTAKITVQHSIIYDKIIKHFGLDFAKDYYQANNDGLEFYKRAIKNNHINCDMEIDSAYIYTMDTDEVKKLEKEYLAYEQVGINSRLATKTDLPFGVEMAIEIPNQLKFHPLKYMHAMRNILSKSGINIYESTRALDIEKADDKYIVHTSRGDIEASRIVITSHYPFDNKIGKFFLKLYQEKSYTIACKTNVKKFDGMYINVSDPIYSLRFTSDGINDILLLCGGAHKVALKKNEAKCFENLESFLTKYFSTYEIVAKWSTQDCMTFDSVPYIGMADDNYPNIFVATGFNKWGMSTSGVAGLILSDLVLGKERQYNEIFETKRFNLSASAKEMTASGAHTMAGLLKRFLFIPSDKPEDILDQTGKVVKIDGKRYCVYRDGDKFHCIEDICTHLGCELKFNTAEKSWDCQCHGSRFDIHGNILEGPATKPLNYIILTRNDLINE